MTIVQAFFLGLLQGLTEFLPVSSSGHLVIGQHFFGFDQPPVVFDILVHLATALAIIIVMLPVIKNLRFNYLKLLFIASIPAGIIGLFLNSAIEQLFNSLALVGLALLITSVILFFTRFYQSNPKPKKPTMSDVIVIGLFQSLAIIPGISRSGSTISAGLFRHLNPTTAFEFSFLLSLPAIFGAQLLQLPYLNLTNPLPLAIGFITAFISGIISLKALKKLVIKNKLSLFSWYCFFLGGFLLWQTF